MWSTREIESDRPSLPDGYDHRLAEIALAALCIGERALIKDLEKQVEHPRVGFLDLIEQHHAVRMRADRVAELATFVVADVARRRADQLGHAVLFHEL